jgi:mRNA interferase MazF
VNRGEVYWHRFDRPDKRRPVLILTRSMLVPHLGTVTVAALTRTIRDVASQVHVGPEVGLPQLCAVNLHQVFTLEKARLGPFVTELPVALMMLVDRALTFALGVGEREATSVT